MINNLPPPKRKTQKKNTPVSSKKNSQNASSTNLDKIYNISPTCNTLQEWRFPQTKQPKFRGVEIPRRHHHLLRFYSYLQAMDLATVG